MKKRKPTSPSEVNKETPDKALKELEVKLEREIPGFSKLTPELQRQVIQVKLTKSHSGPLPDPETFAQYAQLIPDGGNRLMAMAERQLQATIDYNQERLAIRRVDVEAKNRNIQIGQIFALITALAFTGEATYLAMNGQKEVALLLGGTSVVTIVGTFIAGRILQNRRESNSQDSE